MWHNSLIGITVSLSTLHLNQYTKIVQPSNLRLCLVDRASFIDTLFLFQLDTLLFFLFVFTIFSTYFGYDIVV